MLGLGLGFRSELVSELVSGELDRSILGCGILYEYCYIPSWQPFFGRGKTQEETISRYCPS